MAGKPTLAFDVIDRSASGRQNRPANCADTYVFKLKPTTQKCEYPCSTYNYHTFFVVLGLGHLLEELFESTPPVNARSRTAPLLAHLPALWRENGCRMCRGMSYSPRSRAKRSSSPYSTTSCGQQRVTHRAKRNVVLVYAWRVYICFPIP